MQKWRLVAVATLTAAALSLLAYRLLPGRTGQTPSYEWQCAQCQHRFRQAVRDAAGDRTVVDCPKCKAAAAERIMHFQCRNCWTKYDLRGSHATLGNMVCPACGGRAARDLDNPIPGDDEPVEGGRPFK